MKTPHKHSAIIREWALDTSRVVQCSNDGHIWYDCDTPFIFDTEIDLYRFKPEPKPDYTACAKVNEFLEISYTGTPNIEFTFDGETGELKDAKVLK